MLPGGGVGDCGDDASIGFEFSEALLDRVGGLRARLDEVSGELSSAAGDTLAPSRRAKLARELGELQSICTRAEQLPALRQELCDLRELLAEGTGDASAGSAGGGSDRAAGAGGAEDAGEVVAAASAAAEEDELREMALEELRECERASAALERALRVQLMPRDAADDGDAIVEVRAGTGGAEAALFAMEVFELYEKHAALRGWAFERLTLAATELGGCKEATASVGGAGAFGRLKFESGVHRVQRVPATERSGRLHTSAISVAVLPAVEEHEFAMDPSDLRIDTYRASGAGGQHVNTTSSAVRVTHVPTGTVVAIQDERSQHKNKAKALKLIRARLYEAERAARDKEQAAQRSALLGSGDRSERIRTFNFKDDRVTDHRIGVSKFGVHAMLNGELLDAFSAELVAHDEEERLRNLEW
eukprot:g585.t1